MIPLRMRFLAQYSKNWIIQISFLLLIQGIKIMRLESIFTVKHILNMFLDQNENDIDKKISNGTFKYTEINNILYYLNEPKENKYPGNIILFIGGRNGINMNSDFSKRLSNYLSISVATFQYGGYYKSGNENGITEASCIDSITEIYNMLSLKYNVHIIGYSLGCYGGYIVNRKSTIFMISPFYSLERATRYIVPMKYFNLADLIERKPIDKIYISGFYGDTINPLWHLDGPFKKNNIIIKRYFGNHISGVSNILFDEIKIFLEESIRNSQYYIDI